MLEEVVTLPGEEILTDAGQSVLAGILPSHRMNLVMAVQQLDLDHFPDKTHRDLFNVLKTIYDRTTEVAHRDTATMLMKSRGWEPTRILAMEQMYDTYAALPIGNGQFRWAVHTLKDLMARKLTGEAIIEAMEVLESGVEVSHDNRERFAGRPLGTLQRGAPAAREYLAHQIHVIDRMGEVDTAPEGDMRHEQDRALKEYAERRDSTVQHGILTGIKCIDSETGGFQNGELVLFAAYTGQGKSMFATQTAWYNAIGCTADGKKGRDVFFATSETIRPQVMRRIWARHSRLKQFGHQAGLNSKKIKDGTLSPEEEKVFAAVLFDLKTNPDYGKLNILQMPRGADLKWMEMRLREFGREADVCLAVSDYLALVRPEYRRQSKREEYDEIINDAKLMATSFMDGRGVPFLSPWAVKQDAFEAAVYGRRARDSDKSTNPTGSYGLSCLAETSVAEKSADQIMTLLRAETETAIARLQFLKVRDGDVPAQKFVAIDFASTYMGDKDGSPETSIHGGDGMGSGEVASILG